MENNKRNIDDFFLEELGSHTEMPPSSVWDSLEKRLDSGKSDRKRVWWLYLLVAAVLMGSSLAAYFHMSNNKISLNSSENNKKQNIHSKLNSNLSGTVISTTIPTSEDAEEAGEGQETDLSLINHSSTAKEGIGNKGNSKRLPSANQDETIINPPSVISTENSQKNKNQINKNSATNKKGQNNKATLNSEDNSIPKQNGKRESKAQTLNDNSATSGSKQGNNGTKIWSSTVKSNSNAGEKDLKNEKSVLAPENINSVGKTKQAEQNVAEHKNPVKPVTAEKQASPKPVTAQRPNDKGRGLSAFPEEDEKDLLTVEPAVDKDNDFEPEEASKDKPVSKLLLQSEAIGKLRSQNPLAAAPVAGAEIDETTDEQGRAIRGASGGGGGGSASKQKEKAKKSLNMAIGVKMGYERGMQKFTAGKYVGTIFAEVNFSKRLSFVMQPSLKFATANREVSGSDLDTFVNAGVVQNNRRTLLDSTGKPTGFYDYYISQKYDSVSQSATFKKQFMEIEIPFLFRYKVDKNFSVLAGINFIFGKTLGFNISERTLSSGTLYDTVRNVLDTTKPVGSGKFFTQGISGKSAAISELSSPVSPVRFGYTFGLSYVFRERLMVDLIVQQNLSGTSSISNEEVRKIFDQPYVRLSLGYTIFGGKKK